MVVLVHFAPCFCFWKYYNFYCPCAFCCSKFYNSVGLSFIASFNGWCGLYELLLLL